MSTKRIRCSHRRNLCLLPLLYHNLSSLSTRNHCQRLMVIPIIKEMDLIPANSADMESVSTAPENSSSPTTTIPQPGQSVNLQPLPIATTMSQKLKKMHDKIDNHVGKNSNVNTIYNVGLLDKRSFPSTGSSSPKGGAQNSQKTSKNNIPQTPPSVNP